jgi:hypothetical protein
MEMLTGGDAMSLAELLPSVQALSRADRLRLIQFLIAELAREERVFPLMDDKSYTVWTPYDAFGAAATMLNALNQESETALARIWRH